MIILYIKFYAILIGILTYKTASFIISPIV